MSERRVRVAIPATDELRGHLAGREGWTTPSRPSSPYVRVRLDGDHPRDPSRGFRPEELEFLPPVVPDVAGTTWTERFIAALAALCGGHTPPEATVTAWFTTDDEQLQSFVLLHTPLLWSQGIEIIDAAAALADRPAEGEGHVGERPSR